MVENIHFEFSQLINGHWIATEIGEKLNDSVFQVDNLRFVDLPQFLGQIIEAVDDDVLS